MIHTGKGFGTVNKAEVDVFLELSCFFDDPMDVGNLISGFTRVWPKEQSSPWGLDLSFPGWFLLGGVLMRGEGSGGVGWTQTLSLQSLPCTAIDLPISCHVQGFFRLILLACWVVLSCLTLCDPMDYSPPGSSVHGISQARMLERFPLPGDLPNPGIEPVSLVSPALAGGLFTISAPWEAPRLSWVLVIYPLVQQMIQGCDSSMN